MSVVEKGSAYTTNLPTAPASGYRGPAWASPRIIRIVTTTLLIAGAVVLVLFPLSPSHSAQNTVIIALVFAIGAVGLNIITGYAGYLSLSQFAFVGVGAYTVAILAREFPGVSPFVWIPLGGILAATIASVLGLVTYRTRGPSFVIITIAFLFLMQFIAIEWTGLTNGTAGITLPLAGLATGMGQLAVPRHARRAPRALAADELGDPAHEVRPRADRHP